MTLTEFEPPTWQTVTARAFALSLMEPPAAPPAFPSHNRHISRRLAPSSAVFLKPHARRQALKLCFPFHFITCLSERGAPLSNCVAQLQRPLTSHTGGHRLDPERGWVVVAQLCRRWLDARGPCGQPPDAAPRAVRCARRGQAGQGRGAPPGATSTPSPRTLWARSRSRRCRRPRAVRPPPSQGGARGQWPAATARIAGPCAPKPARTSQSTFSLPATRGRGSNSARLTTAVDTPARALPSTVERIATDRFRDTTLREWKARYSAGEAHKFF